MIILFSFLKKAVILYNTKIGVFGSVVFISNQLYTKHVVVVHKLKILRGINNIVGATNIFQLGPQAKIT